MALQFGEKASHGPQTERWIQVHFNIDDFPKRSHDSSNTNNMTLLHHRLKWLVRSPIFHVGTYIVHCPTSENRHRLPIINIMSYNICSTWEETVYHWFPCAGGLSWQRHTPYVSKGHRGICNRSSGFCWQEKALVGGRVTTVTKNRCHCRLWS